VDVIVINTAIDNRQNDVENGNGGGLASSTNATEGYLIVTSIIIGVLILGCIPLCLFLYRRVNDKNKAYIQEEEEEEVLENVPVAPANTPMIGGAARNLRSLHKFHASRGRQFSAHDEGNFHDDLEMIPRQPNLQRVESKSVTKEVTKDGYSSQYGFSNAGQTSYGMMTNAPRRSRNNPADALSPVDELEHGGGFLDDAALTRDIIKVTVWFIEKVKLPQYCELFILNGFTNMDAISAITSMDQLLLLGIERRDHRYQIMRQIHHLNNEYDSDGDILEDGYGATGANAGDTLAQCEPQRPRRRGPRNAFTPLKHEDDEEDDFEPELPDYDAKEYRRQNKNKNRSKGNRGGKSRNVSTSQSQQQSRRVLKNRVRAQRHRVELEESSMSQDVHDMEDVMAPVETFGIPPEHEDRVKVIRGADGGQIWQIDDVMEEDILRKKRAKNRTQGVLPAGKTKGSGKNRTRKIVKQPTISSVEGSRMDDDDVEIEQMDSDSRENDRDLMLEMINVNAPGSSSAESGFAARYQK